MSEQRRLKAVSRCDSSCSRSGIGMYVCDLGNVPYASAYCHTNGLRYDVEFRDR